jgi:hypothetical protein
MKMLKITSLLLSLIITYYSSTTFSQTKALKPINSKNTLVVSESGNHKTYYKLQQKDPSVLLVKGPGVLQVLTRLIITSDNTGNFYSLYYKVDGGEPQNVNYSNIQKSNKDIFLDNSADTPGITKILEIELGPGEHSLEFKPGKESPSVIARYLFNKTKLKKVNWVMLSPSPPNEPVDLVTRENIIHYYRFSEKKPLKIKINGPTTLRILTRFENHYNMKGRIDYRVQLKENGKIIHTYLLSSTYSEVTAYKNNLKLVPGKANEFFIQVPSGSHNYTVVPMDKDKNTILARVLFPKKDVKLEEQ